MVESKVVEPRVSLSIATYTRVTSCLPRDLQKLRTSLHSALIYLQAQTLHDKVMFMPDFAVYIYSDGHHNIESHFDAPR